MRLAIRHAKSMGSCDQSGQIVRRADGKILFADYYSRKYQKYGEAKAERTAAPDGWKENM